MTDDKKQINGMVNHSFWFERVHAHSAAEYASGDVIGTKQFLDVRGDGGGGIIRVINVSNNIELAIALRIWFFRREPRDVVNNAALVLHDNDLKSLAGYRDIAETDYILNGKTKLAHLKGEDANVDFSCPEGFLWYIIEARATETFTKANRLQINMGDWPD